MNYQASAGLSDMKPVLLEERKNFHTRVLENMQLGSTATSLLVRQKNAPLQHKLQFSYNTHP